MRGVMRYITISVSESTYDKMCEVMREFKIARDPYLRSIIKAAVFGEPVVLIPKTIVINRQQPDK